MSKSFAAGGIRTHVAKTTVLIGIPTESIDSGPGFFRVPVVWPFDSVSGSRIKLRGIGSRFHSVATESKSSVFLGPGTRFPVPKKRCNFASIRLKLRIRVELASLKILILMIRRPPRSTQSRSSAASDVYKRQNSTRIRNFSPIEAKLHLFFGTGNRVPGLSLIHISEPTRPY